MRIRIDPIIERFEINDPINIKTGEVAERLKAHAWKACLGKPNVGSNPTLSAINYKDLNALRIMRS